LCVSVGQPDKIDALIEAAAHAVSALENLKIGRAEAYGAVTAAARRLGENVAVEALITAGLQELGKRAGA